MNVDTEKKNDLLTILNKAANILGFNKHSVGLNLGAHKGDGFIGELYKATITNEESKKKVDVVVKKAPIEPSRRDETCVASAFSNEIFFYSKILPALQKLQQDHQVDTLFNSVPTYVCSNSEINKEMLVLKDLTKRGFQMREKDLVLDEEHVNFIFQTYGRFHALLFCLKDQKPEEYYSLTKSLHNVLAEFGSKKGFPYSLHKIVEKSLAALNSDDDSQVREKFTKYAKNTTEMYLNAIEYRGKYSTILHGDCWSNNIMFKYKNSKIEEISLLDFQMAWVGTPVYDLSYFFYSGGCKELFDKLEDFLDVYYNSFSRFVKELGSVPEDLLPRSALSEDWKVYSKFGMFMALLLTQVKLMSREDSAEMSDSIDGNVDGSSKFMNANINNELFNKRVKDILIHMYENGAL
jgi:thiamine kinase-like enzyme